MARPLPVWARWTVNEAPWTVGVEEEVMLLEPDGWRLAPRVAEILAVLPEAFAGRASAETHGSALELSTRPHRTVGEAVHELASLRAGFAAVLAPRGLSAAVAGTHPFAQWQNVEVSPSPRYQSIYRSMRELARREPTFALHVHVAVPTPEAAVRASRMMRVHLPILLALSANSPFWQGRDTRLASARTPIFGMFPRTGIPRGFTSYREWVEAIEALLVGGAVPDPSFVWWDVRLRPHLGTLEVRIMDAQTRVANVAPLVALVQCLVRLEATEGYASPSLAALPETLEENRFLATRDGMRAELIDPDLGRRRPAGDVLEQLLAACAPVAEELGCRTELEQAAALAQEPGAVVQRAIVAERGGDVGAALGALVQALSADFAGAVNELSLSV